MRRAAAALLAWSSLGAAASNWYVQHDNDLGFETDRWYSSGIRVARVERRGDHELELGLLHEVYTPDVKRFDAGDDDRAPTARLFFTAARHDRSPTLFQTLEADIGVRGPAAGGRQLTKFIHHLVRARDIEWSRQESDRLDVQLIASRTQSALDWLNLNYGVVLGNQLTLLHAGAELRFGVRGVNAPSSSVVRFAASPPVFGQGMDGCWSVFLAGSGRMVLRNEMLERNYAVFGGPLVRRRGIARVAGGVSWGWPRGMVSFAITHESKEFAQQNRGHTFGSFTAHWDF